MRSNSGFASAHGPSIFIFNVRRANANESGASVKKSPIVITYAIINLESIISSIHAAMPCAETVVAKDDVLFSLVRHCLRNGMDIVNAPTANNAHANASKTVFKRLAIKLALKIADTRLTPSRRCLNSCSRRDNRASRDGQTRGFQKPPPRCRRTPTPSSLRKSGEDIATASVTPTPSRIRRFSGLRNDLDDDFRCSNIFFVFDFFFVFFFSSSSSSSASSSRANHPNHRAQNAPPQNLLRSHSPDVDQNEHRGDNRHHRDLFADVQKRVVDREKRTAMIFLPLACADEDDEAAVFAVVVVIFFVPPKW